MANEVAELRMVVANDQPLMRSALIQLVEGLKPALEMSQNCPVRCEAEADSVHSVQECLAQIPAQLLIIEIQLQGKLCFELIEWIRSSYPAIRILVVSKQIEAVFAERAIRAGADGYVSTFATAEEISGAVARVLSGNVYLSPQVEKGILQRVARSGQNLDLAANPCASLSNRELHILHHYGLGMSPRQIAGQLDLSVKTVETYRDRLKEKLGLSSAYELLRYALECQVFGTGQVKPTTRAVKAG